MRNANPQPPLSDRVPGSSSRRRLLEALLIVAFWTLLAALLLGSYVLDGRRSMPDAGFIAFEFLQAYVWALLTPLIFWATRRFSVDRSNWHRYVPGHLLLGMLVSIGVDVVENLNLLYVAQPPWAHRLTLSPISTFLELDFLDDMLIYLAVVAAGFARDYFLRYQERRSHAARLQVQLSKARLEALRMQIHPHFLFNTLHAVASLVERDPKGARRMVAQLSELLRYTLDEDNTQEVPLRRELHFLEGYLNIQRIRFPDKLDVQKDIVPVVHDALIPSLIMQPLVENAIKHGVSRRNREGHIILRAHRRESMLVLQVEDDGPGLPDTPHVPEKGLGLRNVEARLHELYGADAALALRNVESGGLVAEIVLPYHTTSDLRTSSVSPA